MMARLRSSRRGQFVVASLVVLVLVAGGVVWLTTRPRSCQPRADDPDGYLFKICTYLQSRQIDVSPGDPTTYDIVRIEERTDKGRPVLWVFLNCCYMGDIAVIDKATGEVIEFRVGAQ